MTDADTKSTQGSPFWRFSLQFYRQPGVADACIALQEEAGVDVNLLLFLLWHATTQRAFTAADVAALEAKIGAWREASSDRTAQASLKKGECWRSGRRALPNDPNTT